MKYNTGTVSVWDVQDGLEGDQDARFSFKNDTERVVQWDIGHFWSEIIHSVVLRDSKIWNLMPVPLKLCQSADQ